MNIGMLWFDNDPKTALEAKVERAAEYYRSKYGKSPTVCFVHPSMLPADQDLNPGGEGAALAASEFAGKEKQASPAPGGTYAAGVEVRPSSKVRPNHFWIGVNGVR